MPIVLIKIPVASLAVCSVDIAVAPLSQQAPFAIAQTPAGCQLILITLLYNLTRPHTLAQLRPRYAQ